MLNFKQWCEQESVIAPKPWKAKKKEILDFWSNLPTGTAIVPFKPVPPNLQGSTYAYDGVRVTGSSQFVNSVISRLKDLRNYEAGDSKLHLIYKQQIDKKTQYPLPNSFVFYVQVQERDKDGVAP